MSASQQIPDPPRIISPTPTPSESGSVKDGYFTRSKASREGSVPSISEPGDNDPELARARSRSRSPHVGDRIAPLSPILTPANGSAAKGAKSGKSTAKSKSTKADKEKVDTASMPNGEAKGFLSPQAAYPGGLGFGSAYWRSLSRSPSPFGLIPIHREWRTFIHKHEVPRKVLHVSIGFMTMWLYWTGAQTSSIHPVLLTLLIPIFTTDILRFRWPALNRLYIRILGPFMRESEAHDRYNGVISYLAGAWAVMRFCRKDVAVMSVLLLSWCDTAASTVGRWIGKYTPRLRRGKSLAGSIAAFTMGVGTAVFFWGLVAPNATNTHDEGINSFAFTGTLTVPQQAREYLGITEEQGTISGKLALGVLSVTSGLVASVSELFNVYGLDDNLTIPVFCGIGLGSILWAFGTPGL